MTMLRKTALVAGLLAMGVAGASAQSGPVDGKGQAGSVSHRGVADPSGARMTEQNNEQVRAQNGEYAVEPGYSTTAERHAAMKNPQATYDSGAVERR